MLLLLLLYVNTRSFLAVFSRSFSQFSPFRSITSMSSSSAVFSISVGVFGFRNGGVFVCGVLCSERDGSSDGLDEPLEADIAES